jgi:hypothetical protein
MRKKIVESIVVFLMIVLLALLIGDSIAGSRQIHLKNWFTKASQHGTTVWTLKSTEADTSEMFITGPAMSVCYWAIDSLATDSVDIRLIYEVLNVGTGWDSVKTTLVSTDTTGNWLITDEAIPVQKIARIRARGVTGNRKLNYVSLKLDMNIYE